MNVFHCLLVCLVVASTQKTFAKISASQEKAIQELSRKTMESQVVTEGKTFGDRLWTDIEAYDLTKEARKAYDSLADDDAFLKFLEKRGVSMSQPAPSNSVKLTMELTLEYIGSSTNFRPAIVAWLSLILNFGAPWETAHPFYLKVAKERPDNFLPKAVTLTRPVRTKEAAKQWFSLFKEAYSTAPHSKERSLCLLLLPSHAIHAAKIPESESHLAEVSDWLDNLEKKETAERLSAIRELSFIKFWVASARKDYAAAARLAKQSRLRALEPLMLLRAGQLEKARVALRELKSDPTLSLQEKGVLNSTSEILGMDGGEKPK